jgi:hypothetical protein
MKVCGRMPNKKGLRRRPPPWRFRLRRELID